MHFTGLANGSLQPVPIGRTLVLGHRGRLDVLCQLPGHLQVRGRIDEIRVVQHDRGSDLGHALVDPGDVVPHVAKLGGERRICLDRGPELVLPANLPCG